MELIDSRSIVLEFTEENVLPYSESFTVFKYRDDNQVFFWSASCDTDPNWISDRGFSTVSYENPWKDET